MYRCRKTYNKLRPMSFNWPETSSRPTNETVSCSSCSSSIVIIVVVVECTVVVRPTSSYVLYHLAGPRPHHDLPMRQLVVVVVVVVVSLLLLHVQMS